MSWLDRLCEGRAWLAVRDRDLTRRLTLPKGATWPRRGAALGAHMGDSLLWLVLVLAAFQWGDHRVREVSLQSLLGIVVTGGLATWMKLRISRERPSGSTGGTFFASSYDRHSFPSGHAVRMACLTLVAGASYRPLVPALCGLTLITLISRLSLGLHYLSDMVAGAMIGLSLGLGILLLWEQIPHGAYLG
jgi:undecaprenyl-diphosphatase